MADRVVFMQALRGVAAMAIVLTHAQVFINGGQFLDIGSRLFHNAPAGSGTTSENVVPRPSLLSTEIVPPWASMMALAM